MQPKTSRGNQESPVCTWVCLCAHLLLRRCVFVCSGKSGVWILSSCLSDRKTSSVKQRGRCISQRYASFLELWIFLQTLPHTYIHVCWACMHSHKHCLLVHIPPKRNRYPFYISNKTTLVSVAQPPSSSITFGWLNRCSFSANATKGAKSSGGQKWGSVERLGAVSYFFCSI